MFPRLPLATGEACALPLDIRLISLSSLKLRLRVGRRHVSNLASYLLARVVAVLLHLAPLPLFINRQGAHAYGSLTLLLLMFSYLQIFDLGMGYAVNQRFARALTRGVQRTTQIVRGAVPVFVGFSLVTCIVLVVSARPISLFLTGSVAYVGSLRILSVAVAFLMCSALLTAVMQAFNRVDWINYSRLIIDGARATGLAVGAFATDGVAIAVAFTVAGAVIKTMVDFGLAVHLMGAARSFLPRFRLREFTLNLRIGLPMVVSVAVSILITSVDRVVVARMFGQAALAQYSVAADLCSRAYFLVWAVTGSVYTVYLTRRAARRPAEDLIRASLLSVGLVDLFFYLPVALFARQLIGWWIGPDFAGGSVGVTRIWAAAATAYLLMCVYQTHLQGYGRSGALALNGLIGIAVVWAGLVTLPRGVGMAGAAAAVLLGFSVQAAFLWILSRRLSLSHEKRIGAPGLTE